MNHPSPSNAGKISLLYLVLPLFVFIAAGLIALPEMTLSADSSLRVPIEDGLWRCEYSFPSGSPPPDDLFVESRFSENCQSDQQINFPSGADFPAGTAVRWRGYVYAPESGAYTFQLDYQDGARLYVNDTLLADGWTDCPGGCSKSNTIWMEAGVWYSLVLEYYNYDVTSQIVLQWDTPSSALQVIPANRLGTDIPSHQSYRTETLKEPFNRTIPGVADVHVASINAGYAYLTANSSTGEVTWYDDNGNFPARTVSPNSLSSADAVYAIDLDGDDINDVLAASKTDDKVVVWKHNQYGNTHTFTESIVAESFSAFQVVGADIDADNHVDIVAVADTQSFGCNTTNPQPIVFWRNTDTNDVNEIPVFDSNGTLVGCGSDQGNILVTDVNADGEMDVIGTRNESGSVKVTWWENDGNETFIAHPLSPAVSTPSYVHAGYISGDSHIDIVQASGTKVRWYENDGNGTFTNSYLVDEQFSGASAIFAGDVDTDGKDDIIASDGNGTKTLVWWENVGNNTLIKHTIADATDYAQNIQVYDRNSDSDLDVVGIGSNTLTWWKNDLKSKRISIEGPEPYYEYGGSKFAHVWDTSTFIGTISSVNPIWPSPPVFDIDYTWKIAGIHQADHVSTILQDSLTMSDHWHAQGISPGSRTVTLTATNPYDPQGHTEGSLKVNVADYTFEDSTDENGTEYKWIDIADDGSELDFPATANLEISLPFDFWFYGEETSTIKVSVDGGIMVGNGRPDVPSNNTRLNPSPDNSDLNYFIAPLWDTYTLQGGKVYIKTIGTSPDRQFIIQWDDVKHTSVPTQQTITFQVILYEKTDNIKVQYQDVYLGAGYDPFHDGGSATVGIRGMNNTFFQRYSSEPGTRYDVQYRPGQWKSVCFYRQPGLPDCDSITPPETVEIDAPETCAIDINDPVTLHAEVTDPAPEDVSTPLTFHWSVEGSSQEREVRLLSTTDSFTFNWPDDNSIKQQTVRLTVSNPAGSTQATSVITRSIIYFETDSYSVNEYEDTAPITATVNPSCPYQSQVTLMTTDGTAKGGTAEDDDRQDYEPKNETILIAPDQTEVVTSVTIWNDGKDGTDASTNDEGNQEELTLSLSNPQNILLADTSTEATLTIVDDDGPDGSSVTVYSPGESSMLQSIRPGGCGMNMTIPANALSEAATVVYTRTDKPYNPLEDYMHPICAFELQAANRSSGTRIENLEAPISMIIDYTAGQLPNHIEADSLRHMFFDGATWGLVSPPQLDEPNQRVTIAYQQPGHYVLVGSKDPKIFLDPLSLTVDEGEVITVTPQLDIPPWREVAISINTKNGNATTEDGDYEAAAEENLPFLFNQIEPVQPFTVTTKNDDKCEGTKDGDSFVERFQVVINNPTNAIFPLDDSNVTIFIVDDDCDTTTVRLQPPERLEYTEGQDDSIELTLLREGVLSDATDVEWVIESYAARLGIDYSLRNNTPPAHFGANEKEQTVTIALPDDEEADGDVTLDFRLTSVAPDTVSLTQPFSVTLTIKDNDADEAPYGVLQFEQDSYTVAEGDEGTPSTQEVCVVRTLGTTGEISVDVAIVAASGSTNVDTQRLAENSSNPRKLVFDTGDDKECFSITVVGDGIPEGDEDFWLVLSNPRYHSTLERSIIGIQNRVPFTIRDDNVDQNDDPGDPPETSKGKIQFRQINYTVDEATGKARIELERVGGDSDEVTVHVLLHSDSAKAGFDYVYDEPYAVTFDSGQTTAFIEIEVISGQDLRPAGDGLEGTEVLQLEIQVPEETDDKTILGSRNTAQLFIRDDDPRSVVYFPKTDYTVSENGDTILIPVERNNATAELTVNYNTSGNDGTATPDDDYEIGDYQDTQNQITFQEGEYVKYIPVKILSDDDYTEGDETFTIRLSSEDATVGTQGEVTVIIVDEIPDTEDTNILQWSSDRYSTDERDGYVEVYVERLGSIDRDVTFTWEIEDGEGTNPATSTADYTAPATRQFTIDKGTSRTSFRITIEEDNDAEGPEDFIVKLTSTTEPENVLIGSQNEAVITIHDSPNEDGAFFYFEKPEYWGREPSDPKGTSSGTVRVICEGDNCEDASVKVAMVDGTTTANADYVYEEPSRLDAFEQRGSDHHYFADYIFTIKGDEDFEHEDFLFLRLMEPQGDGAKLGKQNITEFTIIDAQAPPPCGAIFFPYREIEITEGGNPFALKAIREGTQDTVEVEVHTSAAYNGDATEGIDYTEIACTLKFTAGKSMAEGECEADALPDDDAEGEEMYQVKLINPENLDKDSCNPVLGAQDTVDVVIKDDNLKDTPFGIVSFAQLSYEVTEDIGVANIDIRYEAGQAELEPEDVCFTIQTNKEGGTATPKEDYEPLNDKEVCFDTGNTKTVPITVTQDSLPEGIETVWLKLTGTISEDDEHPNKKPQLGSRSEALLIIEDGPDPDSNGVITLLPEYIVEEADGIARLPVMRMSGTEGDITVGCNVELFGSLEEEKPAEEADFVVTQTKPLTQTRWLTFNEDEYMQMCEIEIEDDDLREGKEIFGIRLVTDTQKLNGAKVGTIRQADVTIIDGQASTGCMVGFSSENLQVDEPENNSQTSVPIPIELRNCQETIKLQVTDAGLYPDDDYECCQIEGEETKEIILGANSETLVPITATLLIKGDTVPENDEKIMLLLEVHTPANTLINPYKMLVTILSNDDPVVKFKEEEVVVGENDTKALIPVSYIPSPDNTMVLSYTLTPDDEHPAKCQEDFHVLSDSGTDSASCSGTLQFPAGESYQNLEIGIGPAAEHSSSSYNITQTKKFSITLSHGQQDTSGPAPNIENSATVVIRNVDGPVETFDIAATPASVLCHQQASSTIDIFAGDSEGHAVRNEKIKLETSPPGTFVSGEDTRETEVTTDEQGRASVPLSFYAENQTDHCPATAIVTAKPVLVASDPPVSNTVSVTFDYARVFLPLLAQRIPEPPYKPIIALVAKPWYFAENGKSEITATFFDPIEQRPIASGQPVTFTVSNGTFVKEQDRQEWTTTTDASGIANATLFANDNTDTGPSLVTVSIASDSYAGSEKIQVYIVPDEGLYLAISPQTLQMADTRSIEVKLYDRENNLVTPPAEIILTPQDDAIVRIVDEAPEIRTTRNGVFNTAIQCRKKGDTSVTVEALLTGAEPQRIDVTCEAGDPHTINLTSSNTERDNGVYRIEINEEEDAVFTATVTDKKGTPLEDIPLSFTWYALTEDVPAMPVVLPDTEQTDEAGEVEVTLKNPELSVGEFFLSAEAEEVNEYVRVNYYASKCSGDDTEQSSNDQMEDAAQLKAGWACEGSFETASADTMTDTVDYFSFKVPEQSPDGEISPGQKYTVTLTLTNIPPGADYDLTLWATDSRTPLSGRPAFNNQPETIEVKLTPGTYYAKVLLRDRATRSDNTYTISYESHSGTQSQEP